MAGSLFQGIWENERYPTIDPWQDKYIFPNGNLPSVGQITTAVEGLFVVEDVHNFGVYYDKTLMAWNAKFQTHRADLARKHGEQFCRMWEYYLLQTPARFAPDTSASGDSSFRPTACEAGTTLYADRVLSDINLADRDRGGTLA